MQIIKLNNIRLYAYHGCLQEERIIGSDYRVDLKIKANLDKSCNSDALEDTVDYVLLQKIVSDEMSIPSNLLEHVAKRIIDRCKQEITTLKYIKVDVSKLNPPIGGDTESVTISLKEKLGKKRN